MEKTIVTDNLRKIVDSRGLKYTAVASMAGYTKAQFCDMLNGRRLITCGDLIRIKTVLGCTYDELFAQPQ